jgi:hypothetical protein
MIPDWGRELPTQLQGPLVAHPRNTFQEAVGHPTVFLLVRPLIGITFDR